MNNAFEPLTPTPWPPTETIDLKSFMRNLSTHRPAGSPVATSGQWRRTVSVVETAPVEIKARPLPVIGFLDGIQARCVAGRIEHRDVTLAYVAAGCVLGSDLLNVSERLAAICSMQDLKTVEEANDNVPVVALPDLAPWSLALSTEEWIDQTRRMLETAALVGAPEQPGHYIVVDGSLCPASPRMDAVGVVKRALETDWLPDPGLMPTTAGWRSPALLLPAGKYGNRDRLTAFVRLRTASGDQRWGFSLVRVEVFAEAGLPVLDAVAALVVSQTQSLRSGDPHAEIQMAAMYRTEQVLKARRPFVIEYLA